MLKDTHFSYFFFIFFFGLVTNIDIFIYKIPFLTKLKYSFFGGPVSMVTLLLGRPVVRATTMQYFGEKLSAAQLQMTDWVGSVRHSMQGALELVWGSGEEDDKEEEEEEDGGDGGGGRFHRAVSPLRSFARRSRRSLHRFSIRSRQTLQRKSTETCSVRANALTPGCCAWCHLIRISLFINKSYINF